MDLGIWGLLCLLCHRIMGQELLYIKTNKRISPTTLLQTVPSFLHLHVLKYDSDTCTGLYSQILR